MGIFGAMTTAVSGLRAQSYAMENISGNIANSRTTGFKRVDTSFVDLIPDTPRGRELAGSVAGFSLATNTVQGDLNTTGIGTNVAINGEGYFVVQERTGYAGNTPTFAGIDLYTRRGDFQIDRSGYMVNGAGFYLKGIPMDPITGDLIGSQPSVVRVRWRQHSGPPDRQCRISRQPSVDVPARQMPIRRFPRPGFWVPGRGVLALPRPYPPRMKRHFSTRPSRVDP